MEIAGYLLVVAVGYLVGSIPFGYLVACACGKDIREHGSGNIGATNVYRVIGKPFGVLVFLFDFLKGLVPVLLAPAIHRLASGSDVGTLAGILAALSAILGHNFTCWLRFRGGKGIATSAGALVGLMPVATPIVMGVWLLVVWLTRYVSLASIVAALILPGVVVLLGVVRGEVDGLLLGFAAVVAALAVWRHRSNIERLRQGTESPIGKKGDNHGH